MTDHNHKDNLNQAPDHSETALLLIDVINTMEFDGGDKLLQHALPMADALAALKLKAKQIGIPAIYANDNFGRWRSDFPKVVEYCLNDSMRGSPIVRRLIPEPDDYFTLKPKHSAFYQTNLDILLNYLGVKTVIVSGIAGDSPDCIASEDLEQTQLVLALMHRVLKADITPAEEIIRNSHKLVQPK